MAWQERNGRACKVGERKGGNGLERDRLVWHWSGAVRVSPGAFRTGLAGLA